jgi:NitT/TauT family transport system permease protein
MTSRYRESLIPVVTILAVIVVAWYALAIAMNAPFQRDLDRRGNVETGTWEFVQRTLSQPKPIRAGATSSGAELF